jgi:hypothetical protein
MRDPSDDVAVGVTRFHLERCWIVATDHPDAAV